MLLLSIIIAFNYFLFKNLGIKRSHLAAPVTKFVYIDTAQLEEDHELQLSIAQQQITNASSGENYYKLKLLEHPLQEVCGYCDSKRRRLEQKCCYTEIMFPHVILKLTQLI